MAYKKPTLTAMKRVANRYGETSKEYNTLTLIEQSRLPVEAAAELLGYHVDDVKSDLEGMVEMDETSHKVLHNCLNTIIPIGMERGLLPCRDLALTTEILRVLVEVMQLQQQQVLALQ